MAEQRVLPEERLAKVEGILEQVGDRLNGVETRLNHVGTRLDHLETRFDELRREMHTNFRWTLGIMLGVLIPMWVSIILTILFQIP